jgi:hypothetical protein
VPRANEPIKIASFKIQLFGTSKLAKPQVMYEAGGGQLEAMTDEAGVPYNQESHQNRLKRQGRSCRG